MGFCVHRSSFVDKLAVVEVILPVRTSFSGRYHCGEAAVVEVNVWTVRCDQTSGRRCRNVTVFLRFDCISLS